MNRLSLRARLMIIGLTGVSVALIMGGLAFYGALTLSIDRALDNEALASARDVAAMVNQNRLPNPVPVSGAQVIQIVDAEQRVVGGSITADRLTPLLRPDELAEALTGEAVVVDGVRLGIDEPLRVLAVTAGSVAEPVSVIAAVPIGDVLATRTALRNALLITIPVLLALLGAIAWRVIGWTLRPVEALRVGAEQISAPGRYGAGGPDSAGDGRLPVPVAADEIRALAITLNGMLDRLAAGRERQRSFVADAAHELRSPLASMRAQLEVAERLGEGGSLPADLLADVARLSGLVEDLLLLARSDADTRLPIQPSLVNGRDLLVEVADGYAGQRVPVTVRPGPPVMIMADAEELRRAVDNLVANAVRHAHTGVELAADVDHDQALLWVTDDGPGVAEQDRQRVFERFTRLDDARARDSGGSGLGLAIVQELVRRAGGTVALIDADPPWRLTAEIRLPRARSVPAITV
ncbi:MAG TPA: HAMP domain-containing sensor histidine kinase [Propionibacteriaceae bacterium]|nr:HAMP domain-containing sensor histidine kinase [Propionibacteriaceae bacterium]